MDTTESLSLLCHAKHLGPKKEIHALLDLEDWLSYSEKKPALSLLLEKKRLNQILLASLKKGKGALVVLNSLLSLLPQEGTYLVIEEHQKKDILLALLKHFSFESEDDESKPLIHPTAIISSLANIESGVRIGAYTVVEKNASLAQGVQLGSHTLIGQGVSIGKDSKIGGHCVLHHALLGEKVHLSSHVVVGFDGFGLALEDQKPVHLPHLGRVVISDRVRIGAHCAIDRGLLGDTVLGEDVQMDNLVHIGHNVKVGARSILAAGVLIAGSSVLGEGVSLGGGALVSDHTHLGDDSSYVGGSVMFGSYQKEETYASYWKAIPHRDWKRAHIRLMQEVLKKERKL